MHQEQPNPFLADVLALRLKFAVSAIAKRTGDDKGNVSTWIRGRKPAPQAFIIRFYTAFKNELADKGIHRDVKELVAPLPPPVEQVTEKDFLRSINNKLSEQNELLKELIERAKRTDQKVDELLRRKEKEIMKSARDYLLGIVATLRSAE
jgi:hypothetical protein